MKRIVLLLAGLAVLWPVAAQAQQQVSGNLSTVAAACGTPPVSGSTGYLFLPVGTNNGSATFNLGGTWSGTMSFFGSADGAATWKAIGVLPSTGTGTAVTTATANGAWQFNPGAYTHVCIAFTTATSGTAVTTINLGQASARAGGGSNGASGTVSGQANGVIPLGTTATSITQQSHLDDGVTTASTITSTENIAAPAYVTTGAGGGYFQCTAGTAPGVGTASTIRLSCPATATAYEILFPTASSTGILHATDATNVNTWSISAVTSADATGNTSGSGNFCLVTSCTMVTPTLGAASATSINKVAITAPATSATLTILNGKTLTANNSLTLAGTDSTTQTFGANSAKVLTSIPSTAAENTIAPTANGVVALTIQGTAGTGNPNIANFSNSFGMPQAQIDAFGDITSTNQVGAFTGYLINGKLLIGGAGTAPSVSSGFGSGASVTANNGSGAFRLNVGTGGAATTGVISLPTASTGWNCYASDITTQTATVARTQQIGAGGTTSVTIGNFSDLGAAAAWVASDVLIVSCFAF